MFRMQACQITEIKFFSVFLFSFFPFFLTVTFTHELNGQENKEWGRLHTSTRPMANAIWESFSFLIFFSIHLDRGIYTKEK